MLHYLKTLTRAEVFQLLPKHDAKETKFFPVSPSSTLLADLKKKKKKKGYIEQSH